MGRIRENIDGRLRSFCERISPQKRLIIILVLGGLLTVINVYMTIWSLCDISHDKTINKGGAYMELLNKNRINEVDDE